MASYNFQVSSSESDLADQREISRRRHRRPALVRNIGLTAAAREEAVRLFQTEAGKYWLFFQSKRDRYLFSEEHDHLGVFSLVDSILTAVHRSIDDLIAWTRLYGPIGGLVVAIFGNKSVWVLQAEVLAGTLGDGIPPLRFKELVEKESNRVAISGTVVTSIAINSLGLESLSQTHWVARASWLFSLVSALLAVYYAGNPVWKIGRLQRNSRILTWIRNGDNGIEGILTRSKAQSDKQRLQLILRNLAPAPSSVLVITAPGLLLSSALISLLAGFGIYLYFMWARELDALAGRGDSRDIFIIYIVSLSICYGVYGIAGIIQDKETSATVRETIRETLLKILPSGQRQLPQTGERQRQSTISPRRSLSTLELGRAELGGVSTIEVSDVQISRNRSIEQDEDEIEQEDQIQEDLNREKLGKQDLGDEERDEEQNIKQQSRKARRQEQLQEYQTEYQKQFEKESQQELQDWKLVKQWASNEGIRMFEMDTTEHCTSPMTEELVDEFYEKLARDRVWRFQVRWTFLRVVAADPPEDVLASMTALFLTYLERNSLGDDIRRRVMRALKFVMSSESAYERWRTIDGLHRQVMEAVKRVQVEEQRSVLDYIERFVRFQDKEFADEEHVLQAPIVEAFENTMAKELQVQLVETIQKISVLNRKGTH
ncbi:hypothetical protein BJX99DRAFT_265749 [Aspergillus californicus]